MTTAIQKTHKGEITLDDVQDKIITIQNKKVLLDSDVAWLYGVETRDINKAVKNNPRKFPDGYIFLYPKPKNLNWWKISTGSEKTFDRYSEYPAAL